MLQAALVPHNTVNYDPAQHVQPGDCLGRIVTRAAQDGTHGLSTAWAMF